MAGETVAGVRVGKGKRTGVIVGSQQDVPLKDGMEDVEAVFAAVQSPEPELNPVSPGKENDTETVEKKVKAKKIRFSMPGGDERSEHDDVESSSSAATPGERHGIMSKYLNMKQRDRTSLSPSEISRVSTAPPSMDRSAATHLEEEEDEETEEEEEDVEEVRKAAAKSTEEESTVLHRREIGSPDAFPMDVDPGMDDDFPPADDNDDDGDDMVPPPPPASPEADDLETEEVELVEESATNVAFPSELDRDLDDDDDEDDKEGEAFNMADDPETPASVRKERVREERRKKAEELAERKAEELAEKKRKKKNGSKTRRLVDESMEEEEAPKSVPRKAKKQKQKYTTNPFTPKGIPSGPREFEAVPVSDLKDSPKQGQEHLRRSRRARMTPLEYWRNERIIYGPNYDTQYESLANMPVPKEVSKALPTPYKKRKVTHRAAPAEAGGKSKKAVSKEYANADDEPFDSTNLRKKQEYMDSDSEVANVWDEVAEESAGQRVVAYHDSLSPKDLPVLRSRKKGESKVVGQAAIAFNILYDDSSPFVGYIMGNLTLPPRGIKDGESVGQCAQTFTVVTGQHGALEIAYGDPDRMNGTLDLTTAQRFLLGPKDVFRIPPGNCYRLQNHSKHAESFLTWTIIRPYVLPEPSP